MTTIPFVPLHKIFILDAVLTDVIDESDPYTFCKKYFGDLLQAIRMKPLAPMSVSPALDLEAPGFSGVQELTTSHTSFHYFWEPHHPTKNPNVHLDLYSCAPFSYEDVLATAHKHFRLAHWTANFIDRTIDPRERLSSQIQGTGDTIEQSIVLSAVHCTPEMVGVRVQRR